jgi:hypothetical protein
VDIVVHDGFLVDLQHFQRNGKLPLVLHIVSLKIQFDQTGVRAEINLLYFITLDVETLETVILAEVKASELVAVQIELCETASAGVKVELGEMVSSEDQALQTTVTA